MWITRQPAGALAGLVDGYVAYSLLGGAPAIHRGLPSSNMTFIVSIGAPIVVCRQTSAAQPPDHYRCVLSGLQASTALIAHDGNQEGVAIELSPLGCRAIFGLPARELWDRSYEASAVLGRAGDELWERVNEAATWDQRLTACDIVLSRLAGEQRVTTELTHAWASIVNAHGQIHIDAVAREIGYSRQHFARLFRDEFGLNPKLAGRIARFESAVSMMRSVPAFVPLGEVAATCGFADQAHLCREVAALAGCTPSELLLEDLPIVQDAAVAGV